MWAAYLRCCCPGCGGGTAVIRLCLCRGCIRVCVHVYAYMWVQYLDVAASDGEEDVDMYTRICGRVLGCCRMGWGGGCHGCCRIGYVVEYLDLAALDIAWRWRGYCGCTRMCRCIRVYVHMYLCSWMLPHGMGRRMSWMFAVIGDLF